MFTLDDALKNYSLGAQTQRQYHKDPKQPDIFVAYNSGGYYYDYNPYDKVNQSTYYTMAFANYWKRGVEKQMQAQGMATSPEAIVIEMAKSLDALNQICGSVLESKGAGINFKAIIKNGDLNHLPYANMFLETFSQSPSRFETLFHAMCDNINSDMELSESHSKNGLITFGIKHKDLTPVKQGVWETMKDKLLNSSLQK
ncbi:MAG: hypothetical protein J6C13_03160 [Clostridia bacterium]|nr:hypothetical protein [Clostridia bacterium]